MFAKIPLNITSLVQKVTPKKNKKSDDNDATKRKPIKKNDNFENLQSEENSKGVNKNRDKTKKKQKNVVMSEEVSPLHHDVSENRQSSTISNMRTIIVTRIVCTELINVELMGQNDPFVVLQLGDTELKTEHVEDAGANATFDDLHLELSVSEEVIKSTDMTVSVYDHNDMRFHTLIGTATVSIASILTTSDDNMEFSMTLTGSVDADTKNKKNARKSSLSKLPRGKVSITLSLIKEKSIFSRFQGLNKLTTPFTTHPRSASLPTSEVMTEKSMNTLIIIITRIVCTELLNVELMGQNDPFVVLQLGDTELKTEHVEDAGANATFDDLHLELSVSEEVIKSTDMAVSVYDHNDMRASALIGKATINIADILNSLGDEVKFSVDLTSTTKKSLLNSVGDEVLSTMSIMSKATGKKISKKQEKKSDTKTSVKTVFGGKVEIWMKLKLSNESSSGIWNSFMFCILYLKRCACCIRNNGGTRHDETMGYDDSTITSPMHADNDMHSHSGHSKR